MDKIKLTSYSKTSGWAAKIGPETLSQVLRNLPKFESDKLLVGLDTSDDAAVYKLDDEKALIQTLDFFTPIVDDPYMFGRIAASNSLSDVYAMGGEPIIALNIVGFPNCLDVNILGEILKGGADKVKEAGALLVGGHSVQDDEPKYGLSVTGLVHPDKVLDNASAKPGDVLILTKPIGTGIINTAIKGELVDDETIKKAIHVMEYLNKYAAEGFNLVDINSCTDITGFGLLGHVYEMSSGSGVSIKLNSKDIPILPGVLENAKMGIVPAGTYKNQHHVGENVEFASNIGLEMIDTLFDPQTSGGLLLSMKPDQAEIYLKFLEENLDTEFAVIGEVVEKMEKDIYVY